MNEFRCLAELDRIGGPILFRMANVEAFARDNPSDALEAFYAYLNIASGRARRELALLVVGRLLSLGALDRASIEIRQLLESRAHLTVREFWHWMAAAVQLPERMRPKVRKSWLSKLDRVASEFGLPAPLSESYWDRVTEMATALQLGNTRLNGLIRVVMGLREKEERLSLINDYIRAEPIEYFRRQAIAFAPK